VKSDPVERVALNLSSPDPVKLESVDVVLHNDLICVDERSYKNLMYNAAIVQNYIILQNQILESYRDYYEKK